MQEFEPRPVGLARKQCQRFHLSRVPARQLDRVFYAHHSCATSANDIAVDSGLRHQILECRLEVLRPPLLCVFRVAGTFAMSPTVDG